MTRSPNRAPQHYVRVTVAPGENDCDFTLVVDAEKTMRCGNRFECIDCYFQSVIRAIFKVQSIGQIRYAFLETATLQISRGGSKTKRYGIRCALGKNHNDNNLYKGNDMTRLYWVVAILFLTACSPAEEVQVVAVTSEAAIESAPVVMAEAEAPPEPTGYTDYIWCSKGENYSLEALNARNKDWLAGASELGIAKWGVSEVTPSGWSSENFDWLTVLFWPDKEARDAAWQTYQDSGLEEQLEAAHPGVEICGGEAWKNVYPTTAYQLRQPSVDETFKVGYQFCSYRDGKLPADLRAVIRGPYMAHLERYDAENGVSSYGAIVGVPDFDDETIERHEGVPAAFDILWVNVWGNPDEQKLGVAAVEAYGQEMMAAFNTVTDCSEEQMYDGRVVLARTW